MNVKNISVILPVAAAECELWIIEGSNPAVV